MLCFLHTYVAIPNIQMQVLRHTIEKVRMSQEAGTCSRRSDSPCYRSIAEVATVDERETVYKTAGDDEPSINAVDDSSLL